GRHGHARTGQPAASGGPPAAPLVGAAAPPGTPPQGRTTKGTTRVRGRLGGPDSCPGPEAALLGPGMGTARPGERGLRVAPYGCLRGMLWAGGRLGCRRGLVALSVWSRDSTTIRLRMRHDSSATPPRLLRAGSDPGLRV